MRSLRVVHLFALSISAASLAGGSARAEAPAETPEPDAVYAHSADRRTLAGHTFIPAADVPWPFTITSFASDLIIGLGTTSASAQVGDQTFSGNFDYAGIGGVLFYEYAFLDHFSTSPLG